MAQLGKVRSWLVVLDRLHARVLCAFSPQLPPDPSVHQ